MRKAIYFLLMAVAFSVSMLSCGGCTTTAQKTKTAEAPVEVTGVFNPAPDEPPLETVTAEPEEQPLLRFIPIADLNGRYGSDQYDDTVHKAVRMIIETRPDVVIGVGDMVAGQKANLDYRKMWRGFHAAVTNPIVEAGIPFAPVAGNHDASAYPQFNEERLTYIDEWMERKPKLEYVDDTSYPLYYSYLVNGVLFLAIDATTMRPIDDVQYAWVEQQLRDNPSPYPAIAYMHVPFFPMTTIKPTETQHDTKLLQLLAKYGVQMVITGHQHAYFPAKMEGITFLHLSATGGGPRPVQHNNGINPKALPIVSIYANHPPYIDTYLLSTSAEWKHFDHNVLPTYIVFEDKIMPRVDITREDAEFARDYMISSHMPRAQLLTLIEALRANDGDWSRIPNWKKDE